MTVTSAASPSPVNSRRGLALVVLLAAAFLDLLDASIVNIALPSIQRDLNAASDSLQWIATAYLLGFAVALITGARLGDIVGCRRMFVIGTAGFTLSSALAGLAPTPGILIAARALQGVMGALMVPQVLSIAQVSYPPEERTKVWAAYGGVAGLATVSGPIVGALLISGDFFGLSWRPIFLVNVPIGIAITLAALAVVPEHRSPWAQKLDNAGTALVTLAMLLLLYPLVQGHEIGWPLWTVLSMAASVPVFALFVLHVRRRHRAGGTPLVVPTLFRKRAFNAGLATQLTLGIAVFGAWVVGTVFMQVGLGWSVLYAGLAWLPFSLGVASGSGMSQQLLPAIGRRTLSLGALLLLVSTLGLIATVARYDAGLHSWQLIPSMLVGGFGFGLVIASVVDISLAEVEMAETGSASGVLQAVHLVGGAIGIAAAGTLFFTLVGRAAADGLTGSDWVRAYELTLTLSAALLVALFLVIFFLPRRARHWEAAYAGAEADQETTAAPA